MLFFSNNCGKSIKPILYDRKIIDIKMHTNKKFILASAYATKDDFKSENKDDHYVRMDLFLSTDFGEQWKLLKKYV